MPGGPVAILAELEDGQYKPVRMDGPSRSLRIISHEHHMIHAGKTFNACELDSSCTSLVFAFKVGSSGDLPHLYYHWRVERTGSMTMYKGRTWTTNTGTRLDTINCDDNSMNTSVLEGDGNGAGGFVAGEIVVNPSGLSGGTLVRIEALFGSDDEDETPPATGNGGRPERILKPGETYTLEIDCASGGAWMALDWYEQELGV